ncbi:MAG: serine hydrolase [Bacteroidota bacterium]
MKFFTFSVVFLFSTLSYSQDLNVNKSLKGFDKYVDQVLEDWNEPGAGVAVVYKDQLVYAKGFGYRDYGNKLPVTENTLFQIASNTKLFTTVAAGMLVEEGVWEWDKPIKESVPEIEFYSTRLNNQVTLRDMLGHKTGISRHDMIWFGTDFTRAEIFDKVKYMRPTSPLRQDFIYNNVMYSAVGYGIELRTGKTWEDFVTEKILEPLNMKNTIYSIAEMQTKDDYGVPYNEKRDTTLLYKIPLKEDGTGVGPAGSMISNLTDMSHWVIALLNDGMYQGKEVISPNILKESMKPGIAFRNWSLETKGHSEILNSTYGMGRNMEIYKGHFFSLHGGDMPGFHSQVAIFPYDEIGIITFVIGDQGADVRDILVYEVADRVLKLEKTDWNGRFLEEHLKGKEAAKQARAQAGYDRIEGTSPTHALIEYTGTFKNEIYGPFTVSMEDDSLSLNFRKVDYPLFHYHYNRFDTPDNEDFGKWSLNYNISPQGDINSITMNIDEGQVIFEKLADANLSNPEVLAQYEGKYDYAGNELELKIKDGKLTMLGPPDQLFVPIKKHLFRVERQDDFQIEFILEGEIVKGFSYKTPGGVYEVNRKE